MIITKAAALEKIRELKSRIKFLEQRGQQNPLWGDTYFTLNEWNHVNESTWAYSPPDMFALGQGNVFATKAAAERYGSKRQAISDITNYCRDNDLLASGKERHFIYYRLAEKEFTTGTYPAGSEYADLLPCLKSSWAGRQVIDKMEKELRIIFNKE